MTHRGRRCGTSLPTCMELRARAGRARPSIRYPGVASQSRTNEEIPMSPTHAFPFILALFAFAPVQDPPKKPAPADPVKERLDKSPRHHEWVDVKSGERTVHCFLAFPEVKGKVGAVVV